MNQEEREVLALELEIWHRIAIALEAIAGKMGRGKCKCGNDLYPLCDECTLEEEDQSYR